MAFLVHWALILIFSQRTQKGAYWLIQMSLSFTEKCWNIGFSNGFQVWLENIWKVCQNQFASRHETKQSGLANCAAIVAFFGQFQSASPVGPHANIVCFWGEMERGRLFIWSLSWVCDMLSNCRYFNTSWMQLTKLKLEFHKFLIWSAPIMHRASDQL